LEIAENMCDRVIIINEGRIIADAPVSQLTRLPGQDQTLEQVFLDLTGGSDVDDMVKELSEV
jgi:ABC-2 type transport system ATP-binding protein